VRGAVVNQSSDSGSTHERTRIDCRHRTAREVLLGVSPLCLDARARGGAAFVEVENLELLDDSVARLLKAFDRLADELGAKIVLKDSSGLSHAFRGALSGNVHLDSISRG
jgi:hypothetical protein